jgi:hypothetical protein
MKNMWLGSDMSPGVAQQCTGTAGRFGNCHVECHAGRGRGAGRPGALPAGRVDGRPGPLPGRRDRRRGCVRDQAGAGTGDGGACRGGGIPFSRVAGDEACDGNPTHRGWLEEHGIGCSMAAACNDVISTAAGGMRADEAAHLLPKDGRQRLSWADGSKGPDCTSGRISGPGPRASPAHAPLPTAWRERRL